MKKIFIVKPFGGIANRLRVISSFLWLKSQFDADLKILWSANSELNANFLDLFQLHPEFEVGENIYKYNIAERIFRIIEMSKLNSYLKRSFTNFLNNRNIYLNIFLIF